MDQIKVSGMRFLDEHGRERIFSGMNVCDKSRFQEMDDYCHNPDTWDFNGGKEATAEEIFNKMHRL